MRAMATHCGFVVKFGARGSRASLFPDGRSQKRTKPMSEPQRGNPPPISEQRSTRRVEFITQVNCKVTGSYARGWSNDIGEGGMSVSTEKTFESGTEVVVYFSLPHNPTGILIEVPGVVVWIRAAESMGIRFLSLNDQQREAIAKHIRLQDQ